jgi:hypothetical protein
LGCGRLGQRRLCSVLRDVDSESACRIGPGRRGVRQADLIAGATLWLVELAVVVLLLNKQSPAYHGYQPAQQ